MSLDFDSGALQTQHEDEDYDQEDYAREQEVKKNKLFNLTACVSSFFPFFSFKCFLKKKSFMLSLVRAKQSADCALQEWHKK